MPSQHIANRVSTRTGAGLLAVSVMVHGALASDDGVPPTSPDAGWSPQIGNCVIFREGGTGLLFRTPTYWLKGRITKIANEARYLHRCPRFDKPPSAYSSSDWARLAQAMPCTEDEAGARWVDVLRLHVAVDEWETPWSHQHGGRGWLFRGQFLEQTLHKGTLIDMDATWLTRCEDDS